MTNAYSSLNTPVERPKKFTNDDKAVLKFFGKEPEDAYRIRCRVKGVIFKEPRTEGAWQGHIIELKVTSTDNEKLHPIGADRKVMFQDFADWKAEKRALKDKHGKKLNPEAIQSFANQELYKRREFFAAISDTEIDPCDPEWDCATFVQKLEAATLKLAFDKHTVEIDIAVVQGNERKDGKGYFWDSETLPVWA